MSLVELRSEAKRVFGPKTKVSASKSSGHYGDVFWVVELETTGVFIRLEEEAKQEACTKLRAILQALQSQKTRVKP